MASHARRGRCAPRLEVLEPRTMLSTVPSGSTPHAASDRSAADVTIQGQAPVAISNDPYVGAQWGLNNPGKVDIDASQAWKRTTGNPATIVAVLDTGIDLANPEFAGRIWTNPDSSGTDGYVGDVHGWNFVANDSNVQDDEGHGTHVAGIIAATGNNGIGVAGVDWNARIMPLKVLDAYGDGTNDAVAAAIHFAVDHGANVINASFGGGDYSQAVADAIGYAGSHGVVFVTAAGNSGTDDDTTPFYPASYRLPNEIVVTAVGESGALPAFADYGRESVDLAAPGVNILSTMPDGSYAYMSGTSMAAPYVTGVVSLVAGLHPTWTPEQVIQQVLATTRPLAGLTGKTVTGGIVDAARAVGVGHPSAHGVKGKHAVATNLRNRSGSGPKHAIPAGPGHHPIAARARVRPGHARPAGQLGQSLALSQPL